ncbi:MAG: hypothetical protein RML56_03415 [Burkholderiales bacterium]|nr:hypothetical protein [Burkholderiales bacterium]
MQLGVRERRVERAPERSLDEVQTRAGAREPRLLKRRLGRRFEPAALASSRALEQSMPLEVRKARGVAARGGAEHLVVPARIERAKLREARLRLAHRGEVRGRRQ